MPEWVSQKSDCVMSKYTNIGVRMSFQKIGLAQAPEIGQLIINLPVIRSVFDSD